jgi:serine protease Do
LDIVLKQISNRPHAFFKSTKDYRYHTQTISTSGTGFIITDDGYVVTNCHVVDESGSFIRRKFILSAFQQVTQTNINALEAAWGVKFTDQQKELLYSSFENIYSSIQSIFLENFKKVILVTYATDTANNHASSKTTLARVIKKGQSMPGKDVAILKLEPGKDFPTLNLANITMPRIGDRVYVFGYPDVVARNQYLETESILEPSLTTGIVSGIRKTITGWNVMQMDAEINHGNSGGPVCDEKGNVIGVATFGSIDYGSGTLAAGMNFSIPVNIIKDFIDSSGIKAAQGRVTILYNKAMEDYDNEEYRDAINKLKKVHAVNPLFPGVSFYINDSNEKIERGLDNTEKNVRFGIILAGLVIFLVLVYFVIKARKKNNRVLTNSH